MPQAWGDLLRTPHLACPPPCPGCGARSRFPLCTGCLREAQFHLAPKRRTEAVGNLAIHSLGSYKDPDSRPTRVAQVLHRFKYDGDRSCGRALVWLVATCGGGAVDSAAAGRLVIPVPLSRIKLHRRGFNQAAWIARGLASRLRLPISSAALQRLSGGDGQAGLPGAARRRQPSDLFVARPALVDELDVLLVDDVVTTGTTLANCAVELTGSGARSVVAVTLLGVGNFAKPC